MAATDKLKYTKLEYEKRLISENLVDAIWVVDLNTLKYEYMTASIEDISGYSVDDYLGHTVQQRLTPESFQKVQKLLAKEIKKDTTGEKAVHAMELEMIHKKGSRYWIEIKAKLTDGPDGKRKIIGITKNITLRKNAELKQLDLISDLKKALSEKEALLKEVNQLRELLPICSGCKRIRDEDNKWWPLDVYIQKQTSSDLSHTICPDCKDVLYGDVLTPKST